MARAKAASGKMTTMGLGPSPGGPEMVLLGIQDLWMTPVVSDYPKMIDPERGPVKLLQCISLMMNRCLKPDEFNVYTTLPRDHETKMLAGPFIIPVNPDTDRECLEHRAVHYYLKHIGFESRDTTETHIPSLTTARQSVWIECKYSDATWLKSLHRLYHRDRRYMHVSEFECVQFNKRDPAICIHKVSLTEYETEPDITVSRMFNDHIRTCLNKEVADNPSESNALLETLLRNAKQWGEAKCPRKDTPPWNEHHPYFSTRSNQVDYDPHMGGSLILGGGYRVRGSFADAEKLSDLYTQVLDAVKRNDEKRLRELSPAIHSMARICVHVMNRYIQFECDPTPFAYLNEWNPFEMVRLLVHPVIPRRLGAYIVPKVLDAPNLPIPISGVHLMVWKWRKRMGLIMDNYDDNEKKRKGESPAKKAATYTAARAGARRTPGFLGGGMEEESKAVTSSGTTLLTLLSTGRPESKSEEGRLDSSDGTFEGFTSGPFFPLRTYGSVPMLLIIPEVDSKGQPPPMSMMAFIKSHAGFLNLFKTQCLETTVPLDEGGRANVWVFENAYETVDWMAKQLHVPTSIMLKTWKIDAIASAKHGNEFRRQFDIRLASTRAAAAAAVVATSSSPDRFLSSPPPDRHPNGVDA